jgi:hypothetical protein
MAQYRSDKKIIRPEGKTNYEVFMLSDRMTPSGSLTDAFGRLRVSQPYTLFDSVHRFDDNGKWDTATTGSGTITILPLESSINLTVTTANTDSVTRQTFHRFVYQPGKSLLIMNTFVMGPAQANTVYRVGYFGANNGIYLERDGNTLNLVKRANTTGTLVETRVAQADWNIDKFDGTGESYNYDGLLHGDSLDVKKTQIFWIDIEWLGVGDVRCGFVVDGLMRTAHVFHHDNLETGAYMTTACLPLRYEMFNKGTGPVANSSFMKQICSTVISEGGYEGRSEVHSIGPDITALKDLTNTNTWYPLTSIKLASGREEEVVLPVHIDLVGINNTSAFYKYRIYKNATLGNTSWQLHYANTVSYDLNANTITGGQILQSGYLNTAQKGGSIIVGSREDFSLQLGAAINNTSDIITVAVQTDTAGADAGAIISWNTLT